MQYNALIKKLDAIEKNGKAARLDYRKTVERECPANVEE